MGGSTGVWRGLGALALCLAVLCLAPRGEAVDFLDGRVQVHGYGEMQLRGTSRNFRQELELAQWYNILNVEVEADLLRSAWGPIDSVQVYVRGEARYDALYNRGFAMLPSLQTYGNRSRELPNHLRNAKDADFAGTAPIPPLGDQPARDPDTGEFLPPPLGNGPRGGQTRRIKNSEQGPTAVLPPRMRLPNAKFSTTIEDEFPTSFVSATDPSGGGSPGTGVPLTYSKQNVPTIEVVQQRRGLPGYAGLSDPYGADQIPNTLDDPFFSTFGGREQTRLRFALKDIRGADGGPGRTDVLGPWRPRDKIEESGLLRNSPNPFRGRTTPLFGGQRLHTRDDPAGLALHPVQPDPFPTNLDFFFDHPLNRALAAVFPASFNPSGVATNCTRAGKLLPVPGCEETTSGGFTFISQDVFGGDFSGIVPCVEPNWSSGSVTAHQAQFVDLSAFFGCVPRTSRNLADLAANPAFTGFDTVLFTPGIDHPNIRVIGGRGELPMRPAPDIPAANGRFDKRFAQGLYVPSRGLARWIDSKDLDSHPFNINENRRAWNRGDSQQRSTKELKEAYVDIEWFDNRLWTRIGKQNIVWGKTEFFRTADQFNPQDLALSTLPSLEESRISLWSARAIYSLYDVGPLQDVRIEAAINFDRFQPNDLGACGEPYTDDSVCALTAGLWAHSLTGAGVAGFDRPDNPWDSTRGLEFGGRVEWRWDRFSFAVMDFYGYNDFPFPERISSYDRNVDPVSGRPRIFGATDPCSGLADGAAYVLDADGRQAFGADNRPLVDLSRVSASAGWSAANSDSKDYGSFTIAGIGRDPSCLKPGGAALGSNLYSGLNANGFGLGVVTPDLLAEVQATVPGASVGDSLFVEMNVLGALNQDPASGVQFVACDPGIGSTDPIFPNCLPARGFNAVSEVNRIVSAAPGLSPQNALEFQPANQQLFSWVCSTTVSIAASVDSQACAWTVFSSPAFLVPRLVNVPLGEVLSTVFAGEPDGRSGAPNFMRIVSDRARGDVTNPLRCNPTDPLGGCFFVAPLNRDPNDGVISAFDVVLVNRGPDVNGDRQGDLSPDPFVNYASQETDFLTLDSTLSNEQRAILGCGPYFGTRCDSSSQITSNNGNLPGSINGLGLLEGGGLDFQYLDASALLQSFPGFEGTDLRDSFYAGSPFRAGTDLYSSATLPSAQAIPIDPSNPDAGRIVVDCSTDPRCVPGMGFLQRTTFANFRRTGMWTTTSTLPQPGTIEFEGGPVCTRPGGGILPGCRGASGVLNRGDFFGADAGSATDNFIDIEFDYGYDPRIDGCVFSPALTAEDPRSPGTEQSLEVRGFAPDGSAIDLSPCQASNTRRSNFRSQQARPIPPGRSFVIPTAGTLYHPLAGCHVNPADALAGLPCDGRPAELDPDGFGRDFDQEFVEGTAQVFRNELAAFSYNFMLFLIASACDEDTDDIKNDPECFDDDNPWAVGRCSLTTPQFCGNVKGFFGATGVRRNVRRAGGNARYGRRTFIWQGGGEVVMRYDRRNVFGFAMDFAEDTTKSNWGLEFVWINGTPFLDNNQNDNLSKSDTYSLTISVDRPTFINFLNANRTFFINTQWFLQYIPNHEHSFLRNGPFNALFTVSIFTGYFQDRLLPNLVTVYDFRSQSGAFLPNVSYRFTEAFSVGVGLGLFYGRTQLRDMPVNEIGAPVNRAAQHAYKDPTDQFISSVRNRDEIFMRLRYTF